LSVAWINGIRLQEIGGLIDVGKLQVIIGKEFPLREAAAAHELSEAGHVRGKIILNVAS
jgi:NADPH:quinone reductase-like Zn-dependent oxidoreductase